jgi:hypothetical protein
MPAPAAAAETLKLDFPLECTPGRSCWIPSYVDHDPTKGISDYTCGKATYNGTSGTVNRHKGTDIAIRDKAAMRRGVPVLAAAAGRVAGLRDGMADIGIRKAGGLKALKGKDCGNGVRIIHPGGWDTQYCHMLKGSITVKKGDAVSAGQALGLVGLSGATSYPHLHLTVRKGKEIVDPFVGLSRQDACGPGRDPLWKADVMAKLPYKPTSLYSAGFATTKPDQEGARNGRYREKTFSRLAPFLVLWVDMFRVQMGDRLSFTITGPDEIKILQKGGTLKKNLGKKFCLRRCPKEGRLMARRRLPGRNQARARRGRNLFHRPRDHHRVRAAPSRAPANQSRGGPEAPLAPLFPGPGGSGGGGSPEEIFRPEQAGQQVAAADADQAQGALHQWVPVLRRQARQEMGPGNGLNPLDDGRMAVAGLQRARIGGDGPGVGRQGA